MAAKKPKIEIADLSQLTSDPENVRRRDDRAKATLKTSIDTFGPARSIVLDADNVVRAGNGTLEQAAASGIKRIAIVDADADTLVAVRRKDWTADDARAYAIADNRAGDLSTFDFAAVHEQLQALSAAGHEDLVKAAGFGDDLHELNELMAAAHADATATPELDTSPQLTGMEFRVVVDCDDESHQVKLLERFNQEGLKCRALIT